MVLLSIHAWHRYTYSSILCFVNCLYSLAQSAGSLGKRRIPRRHWTHGFTCTTSFLPTASTKRAGCVISSMSARHVCFFDAAMLVCKCVQHTSLGSDSEKDGLSVCLGGACLSSLLHRKADKRSVSRASPSPFPGWYLSCVMCRLSCVRCHLSCVMFHVSCVMGHGSCVMCHAMLGGSGEPADGGTRQPRRTRRAVRHARDRGIPLHHARLCRGGFERGR